MQMMSHLNIFSTRERTFLVCISESTEGARVLWLNEVHHDKYTRLKTHGRELLRPVSQNGDPQVIDKAMNQVKPSSPYTPWNDRCMS